MLDALLSCLPCQGADGREAPVSPTTLLTVYASNETLCFRAKGLTDRQLRRHLETLETAGLIRRRDSANGKRFPVMQHGKPVGAFGLDLSPLFAQADELLALALRRREEAAELRGLKAQILQLRAACSDLGLDEAIAAFVDGLRNLVRRTSLTLVEARAALAQLTAVLSGDARLAIPESKAEDCRSRLSTQTPDSDQGSMAQITGIETTTATHNKADTPDGDLSVSAPTSASDGQNVRHKEQESDTKKIKARDASAPCWDDLTEVSAFYAEPTSTQDATVIAFEFGRLLRISQDLLAAAAAKLGLWELLRLEDRIARQIGSILNPDAYLRSVLRS